MENGSRARKIGLAPKRALAVVPLPPVVLTESVAVLVVVPSMTNGFGVTEQLEPTGPEQVNATELLNPFSGAMDSVYCAVLFWVTVTPVVEGVTLKGAELDVPPAASVPVPVRVICCGEFEAPPVTVNVAVSAIAVLGVKVMLKLQLVFAAKVAGLAGQLPETMTKSELPVMTMLLMASAEDEELLVSVTALAELVVLTC